MIKLKFPIIRFSEHKIRLNSLINNILPGYTFCYYNEKKSTHVGTGFYLNEKRSYGKRNGLSISLDNNLESSFRNVNLPKKIILSIDAFINTLICRQRTLIQSILTRFKKSLSREDKFCFLIGDLNINLKKINNKYDNYTSKTPVVRIYLRHLFNDKSKTLIDKNFLIVSNSLLYLVT